MDRVEETVFSAGVGANVSSRVPIGSLVQHFTVASATKRNETVGCTSTQMLKARGAHPSFNILLTATIPVGCIQHLRWHFVIVVPTRHLRLWLSSIKVYIYNVVILVDLVILAIYRIVLQLTSKLVPFFFSLMNKCIMFFIRCN